MCARLDGLHCGGDIRVAREKDDRERRAELSKPCLQLRTSQSRYPDVEQDAATPTVVGQMIEQLLGRRIGRHLVADLLETALECRTERGIIINYMDHTEQASLPQSGQR